MLAGYAAEETAGAAPGAQQQAAEFARQTDNAANGIDRASLGLPEGDTGLPQADIDASSPIDLHVGERFARGQPAVPVEINVSDADARAIVAFWSDIIKEHMEFYTLWLTHSNNEGHTLSHRASDLERRWAHYGDRFADYSDYDLDTLAALVNDTGMFKNDVLDMLRSGQAYVGAVFESFVLDNLTELDYFVDALANRVGGQAEIDMWVEHARGHAFLDSHMLDPLMADEISKTLDLATRFATLARHPAPSPPVSSRSLRRLLGSGANGLAEWLTSQQQQRQQQQPLSYGGSLGDGNAPMDRTPPGIMRSMNRLAAVSDSPAAASEAYLQALKTVRARMEHQGARISGIAPHLLVSHSIREIAYGLARIEQIQSTL